MFQSLRYEVGVRSLLMMSVTFYGFPKCCLLGITTLQPSGVQQLRPLAVLARHDAVELHGAFPSQNVLLSVHGHCYFGCHVASSFSMFLVLGHSRSQDAPRALERTQLRHH